MAKIEMIHRFFEFFSDLNKFSKNLCREKFDPKKFLFLSFNQNNRKSYLQPNLQNQLSKMGHKFRKIAKITTNSKCQKKLKNDKIPKKPKNIITFYLFFLEFVWIFGYFQIP